MLAKVVDFAGFPAALGLLLNWLLKECLFAAAVVLFTLVCPTK